MLIPCFPEFLPDLDRYGVAVIEGALTDTGLARVWAESECLSYKKASPRGGSGSVRQDYEYVSEFPPASDFIRLARELEVRLNEIFGARAHHPLGGELLKFNDLRLQHYPARSQGIEPHYDGPDCRYLIALVVIVPGSTFCICDNKTKANPIMIASRHGDLILMRGVGLFGSKKQVCHYVPPLSNKEKRITFAVRHIPNAR